MRQEKAVEREMSLSRPLRFESRTYARRPARTLHGSRVGRAARTFWMACSRSPIRAYAAASGMCQ